MTRCKQQDGLLTEQGEEIRSLEADRAEVSPIGPNEVEGIDAVNGCMRSLGGMETPGILGLTRIPEVIVPVCVVESISGASVPEGRYGVSVMACVSACEELLRGRIQMGDGCGKPFVPYKVIVVTAPASQGIAYEARLAFSERPLRTRLRGRNPAWKRSAWDSTRPRGRLKWRRGLVEFGTRGFPRGRGITCCIPRVLFAERAERVPGTMRSC